jgi:hypothetical protein
MAQRDLALQKEIAYTVRLNNAVRKSQVGYEIPVGSIVSVYNPRDPMAKRRDATIPGRWRVVSTHPYVVENESGKRLMVARAKLNPIV